MNTIIRVPLINKKRQEKTKERVERPNTHKPVWDFRTKFPGIKRCTPGPRAMVMESQSNFADRGEEKGDALRHIPIYQVTTLV